MRQAQLGVLAVLNPFDRRVFYPERPSPYFVPRAPVPHALSSSLGQQEPQARNGVCPFRALSALHGYVRRTSNRAVAKPRLQPQEPPPGPDTHARRAGHRPPYRGQACGPISQVNGSGAL